MTVTFGINNTRGWEENKYKSKDAEENVGELSKREFFAPGCQVVFSPVSSHALKLRDLSHTKED